VEERGIGRRIMVVGGCGAGKSTFSKKLASLTGLPLIHLDRLGWRGTWEAVPREEFDALLARETARDDWIIDGNYSRTLPARLARADTVIWFDFSGIRCFIGVAERFFKNYGKTRDDMGGDCPETFSLEKLRFFHRTLWGARKTHTRIAALLEGCPGKRVIVFKTRREADRFLRELTGSANGKNFRRESNGMERA